MLSPLYPPDVLPVPATVLITPVDTVILRTTLKPPQQSPKYTFPAMSRLIPCGCKILAAVAWPLSPLYPEDPVPAIVVMTLVDAVILRTRWLLVSLKYTLPMRCQEMSRSV